MLSRKNCKAIADCIALARIKGKQEERYKDYEDGINAGCQDIAYRLVDYLEQDNPRFDRQKFLDACFDN